MGHVLMLNKSIDLPCWFSKSNIFVLVLQTRQCEMYSINQTLLDTLSSAPSWSFEQGLSITL
jgi:hypothetical protein